MSDTSPDGIDDSREDPDVRDEVRRVQDGSRDAGIEDALATEELQQAAEQQARNQDDEGPSK